LDHDSGERDRFKKKKKKKKKKKAGGVKIQVEEEGCSKKKKKVEEWGGAQLVEWSVKEEWEVILTLLVHNNYTHTKHIMVGPSVWAPPQCVLCECSVLVMFFYHFWRSIRVKGQKAETGNLERAKAEIQERV
jgi:hypothetical protein